jgi:sialate O-acetylesterase
MARRVSIERKDIDMPRLSKFIPPVILILVALIIGIAAGAASAAVRLPAVFGDDMVLQRDKPIPVWGWADPGEVIILSLEKVKIRFTTGDNGKWMATLPPMKAGGPHEMTVEGASSTATVQNILIGEVWLCSGQSNMEMGVARGKPSQWSGGIFNYEEEIAAANHPEIRLFHVPRRASGLPVNDVRAAWKVCGPETIPSFSAVAYFFGRKLHKELGVPVGLIMSSWGGTRIEPWTPPAGFAPFPELKGIADQIESADAKYRQELAAYLDRHESWLAGARRALDSGGPLPDVGLRPEHGLAGHWLPTGLYNGMIHALVPFAVRGAIWYQGEANRTDGMLYHTKMKALIHGWRTIWKQDDFAFYYVQLAPFKYGGDPLHLPRLWEAQAATLSVPDTGMAVTTDISELNDIHPRNKQDVGLRLALWALAQTYGFENLVHSGPLYRSMKAEGVKIRISFDHIGGGLASRDGKPLDWFTIAGADRKFVEAQAAIEGDEVVVWSDAVSAPEAVRFGWHQEAEPNLMNKEGLPASPFRTDKW